MREVACIEGGAGGISFASSVCYVWSIVPESWGMVLEVAETKVCSIDAYF